MTSELAACNPPATPERPQPANLGEHPLARDVLWVGGMTQFEPISQRDLEHITGGRVDHEAAATSNRPMHDVIGDGVRWLGQRSVFGQAAAQDQ